MIVVSDTSPLTSLLTIGRSELLPAIFGEVIAPPEVHHELKLGHGTVPEFLRLRAITNYQQVTTLMRELDRGEAEAIALARETNADLVLMDEKAGRRVAEREGLRIMGLLGVLVVARRRGLIPSVREVATALRRSADFRVADEILEAVLREVGE